MNYIYWQLISTILKTMMNNLRITILLAVFISGMANAQVLDPLHEDRIKKLESDLVQLRENMFQTDSMYYARAYNTGLEGVFAFDKLYSETELFHGTLTQSSLLLKLMNVNNPASFELRKKIMTDLRQMIESKIADITGTDTARKRNFFSVVRNIFNNPLIQSAAAIVPIGAPVMQILSAVSSVVAPRVKVEKNSIGGVKNVLLDIEGMLNESPLRDIANRIMPYLSFYDSLYAMNNDFNREMEFIRNTAGDIRKSVYGHARNLNELIGWKQSESLNLAIGRFNAVYTSPDKLRTQQLDIAKERFKADMLFETAAPVLQEYKRLADLRSAYEYSFSGFEKKYLAVLKKYAAKNNLFKEYLDPVIADLTPLQAEVDPNVVVSAPLIMQNSNIPAANGYQEELLQKFYFKYQQNNEGSSGYIKKVIF
jgi:hypothetical protein